MKSLSVLIVDDSEAARNLLRSVLTGLGLNKRIVIQEAASGSEALHLCNIDFYNIIFLDIQMPDMNGFDVLQRILPEIPDQFVAIVSANATITNVQKTINLGGKGFIVKPYTTKKVKGVVEKYLQLSNDNPPETGKKIT